MDGMNQRNIEALCRIYCDAALKRGFSWDEINDDLQTTMQTRDAVVRVCRQMAAAGVLVPSALTDEEAQRIAEDEQEAKLIDRSTANSPDAVRTALERIAKGEDG